jgi:hypothetical protein
MFVMQYLSEVCDVSEMRETHYRLGQSSYRICIPTTPPQFLADRNLVDFHTHLSKVIHRSERLTKERYIKHLRVYHFAGLPPNSVVENDCPDDCPLCLRRVRQGSFEYLVTGNLVNLIRQVGAHSAPPLYPCSLSHLAIRAPCFASGMTL